MTKMKMTFWNPATELREEGRIETPADLHAYLKDEYRERGG